MATETEQKILTAAREEFIERGFQGARMQAIADRAQTNKTLLHYYFRSKSKLYETVLWNMAETFFTNLQKRLKQQPRDIELRTLLREIIATHVKTLSQNPDFPRLIIREMLDGGENIRLFIKQVKDTYGHLPRFFVQALDKELHRGTIRDIEPIHIIWNIIGMSAFTFLSMPIASFIGSETGNIITFDEAFFEKRAEAIITMTCDGLFT